MLLVELFASFSRAFFGVSVIQSFWIYWRCLKDFFSAGKYLLLMLFVMVCFLLLFWGKLIEKALVKWKINTNGIINLREFAWALQETFELGFLEDFDLSEID